MGSETFAPRRRLVTLTQNQRVQRLCRTMGVSESEAREALESVGWDHQRAADWLRRFTQIRGVGRGAK
jgi:hypothetical protein